MWHSHLNYMEIPETKCLIPKGFQLGTTLSQPNRSIEFILHPWPIQNKGRTGLSLHYAVVRFCLITVDTNPNPNPKTAFFEKKIDHDSGPDPTFYWLPDQGLNTVLGKTEEPQMQVARSICKLWRHITDPFRVTFFHLCTESSILCEMTG